MKMQILILTLLLSPFLNAELSTLPTVEKVDLTRYLGKWYEIARFEHKFQKGCTATEALYSQRDDGDISIINRCHLETPKGKLKEAKGRAWVVDKATNSKLKVQFFLSTFKINMFAGDYWILDLDKDYQYALIGDPSRQYLWILNRTNKMDDDTYKNLVEKAKELQFDISKLQKTKH